MTNKLFAVFTVFLVFRFAKCQVERQFDSAVERYAEVRYLLNQFYRRIARQHGTFNDYDAKKINVLAKNVSISDGTEASANRQAGVIGDLFESDILLTLPQAEEILRKTNRRNSRQAQLSTEYFWQKLIISYRFEETDPLWKSVIRSALRHIEQHTCFRFQENGYDMDYLSYFRGSGCWSSVGRIGGRQLISIGFGCEHVGIVAHETLHALGLWHEQSRSDRDNYININYNNIYRGTEGNFEKRTVSDTDNMGQPYDLGSVMHYASKAFSFDYNKYTIVTRDPKYQQTIGQRWQLSFKDAKMINLRYCQKQCSRQLVCSHGGYTDPNDCSKCRCPDGYGGKLCDEVEPSSTLNCGGDLTATNYYQTLQNPSMSSNMRCIWRIRSAAKVQVKFDRISLTCLDTCESYVEVKYTENVIASGPRLCCNTVTEPLISEGTDFLVIFSTTDIVNSHSTGFQLQYRAYGEFPITYTLPPYTTSTTSTTKTNRIGVIGAHGVPVLSLVEVVELEFEYGRVTEDHEFAADCSGESTEEEVCGLEPCPYITTEEECRGKVNLPCELLDKLVFDTPIDSRVTLLDSKTQVYQYPYIKTRESRSVAETRVARGILPSDDGMCEKRFSFPCPSYSVSINIAWKDKMQGRHLSSSRGCCYGYRLKDGICVLKTNYKKV
ncbi:unnamed protein product [Enterobius vermicularis]|uniref:Zinc metalloproteinase n=1 Tax=Enterobius vermicularis TaxID=51028 RepID=A0A0N4VH46_ENTVE|nr:unnamed protein product [Enterobius vermicularis]